MKLRMAFADANKIVRRSIDFRYIGELTVNGECLAVPGVGVIYHYIQLR